MSQKPSLIVHHGEAQDEWVRNMVADTCMLITDGAKLMTDSTVTECEKGWGCFCESEADEWASWQRTRCVRVAYPKEVEHVRKTTHPNRNM